MGHILPRNTESAKESYAALDIADLQRLFGECINPSEGKQDIELATLIALGYYTGARLEEIGSLRPGLFSQSAEDIKFFKITESKTSAGLRDIPIHQDLLQLVELLNEKALREGGATYLTNKITKRGTKVDHLSKRFGRLKSRLGYTESIVFHSLRKTFITELLNRQAPLPIVQKIVGHEGSNVTTGIYYQTATVQHTKPVVEMLPSALNLEPLIQAHKIQSLNLPVDREIPH